MVMSALPMYVNIDFRGSAVIRRCISSPREWLICPLSVEPVKLLRARAGRPVS